MDIENCAQEAVLGRFMFREAYPLYDYRPRYRTASVVRTLIIINVAVFVALWFGSLGREGSLTAKLSDLLVGALALHPRKALLGGYIWQLVTYSFLHADVWHILFNMLALFWFGREMEAFLGKKSFLGLYLVGALVAGLAHSLVYVAAAEQRLVIGASGAVFAVLVLFACHFPNRHVLVFFVLPMKVKYFAALLIGLNLLMFGGRGRLDVAVLAHLGGAAYGFIYYRYRYVIESLPSMLIGRGEAVMDAWRGREMAKLRRLSEKAARGGLDSLSPKDRKFLLKMSDKLRGGGR